ncbi:MAG TPA: tyrosine-type recombinase/integrase [Bacteroidales bacterium]|nr:tyrosine-type recombinase/integrase [Bacteroidales bacterium]
MNRIYYSVFGPYIVQFIELKNSLGYKYKDAGYALSSFDHLALEKNVFEIEVTKELTDEYCKRRPNESGKTRYNRIQILSQFARVLCDLGFRSYIPKLPQFKSTYTPYIFSRDEMHAIFRVCDELAPSPRNRNSTVFAIPVLIRLLYGTGIRISEAMYLACNDIDFHEKYLILRNTKNGKDRMVPISDSLANVCEMYLMYRNLFPTIREENRFFIKPDGSPMSMYNAYKWFRRIIYTANISHGGRGHGPRLHDLRHTFSVHSLASMSESELDMYYSLPLLSTYLGHQSLEATNSYVRLTAEMYPDLIKKASNICSSVFPVINTNTGSDETD